MTQREISDMIVNRAYDPIPFLIAWVRISVREIPLSRAVIIIRIIINIPVWSISGVI